MLGSFVLPMTHPLIRIPCILVATVGLHVAITPPNPPPREEEKAASTKLESFFGFRSGPLQFKILCWSVAFAEVAVTIANYAPSLPVSKTILSNLIFAGGSAERIHLSSSFFFGSFMTTMGAWIRYRCYKTLGKLFTFEMTIGKDHALITSGPYSVVRHPAYTGTLAAFIGLVPLYGAKGSWLRESGVLEIKFMKEVAAVNVGILFVVAFGLLHRMFKEDENLHQRYGKQWEEWARRVPCRLIPWLF